MRDSTKPIRSLLFVPGNRPDRFHKARASGVDAYCIDLEDAVPTAEKSQAREATLDHINQAASMVATRAALFVRINSLSTLEGVKDVISLAEDLDSSAAISGVVLPMASSAFEVKQLARLLSPASIPMIVPVIETPEGLRRIDDILSASDRICAVGFGMADYTAVTGGEMTWDALLYARSRLAEAAGLRSVQVIDGPWFDIADNEGLREEASRVAALGFSGKFAIHPTQVEAIHGAFRPSDAKVKWARDVLKAWSQAGGGVVAVSGVMIDQPLVTRAERILSLAGDS